MNSAIWEMVYFCENKKPIEIIEKLRNTPATNVEIQNKEIQRSRLIKNTFAVPNMTPQMQAYSSTNVTKNVTGANNRITTTNEAQIKVKIEELEMPKIRKRVCRKMLSIFTDEFNVEKKAAKNQTVNLESRFNLQFSFKNEKYVNAIKIFFKNQRVCFFCD